MDGAKFLSDKAAQIRRSVLAVSVRNGAGHIAPSLSCVEILVALYYQVMNYRPAQPAWPDRDRLIVSKAHGAYALYAILADQGIIPAKEWEGFYTDKSTLMGCLERRPEYGIEAGCGSLGHGLPLAVGMAWGARLRGLASHVFCLTGDGELQEGTTWEALQFARKHEVGNLTLIVDRNRLQAMDFIANVMDRHPDDLERRLEGFGLAPQVVPGHDAACMTVCLARMKSEKRTEPGVVIADTVKGHGCKCMENLPKFHFRLPTAEELEMGK
jgi:transketolase